VNQPHLQTHSTDGTSTWGVIPVGESHVSIRHLIMGLGLALWLLPTFCATGVNGIAWFAFNISFLLILIVVSGAVRSVSLHKLAICFFAGGLFSGLVLALTMPLAAAMGPAFPLRQLVTVPVEELAKLVAVGLVIWRGRKFSSWTLGATDVLLMGAAVGAGFAFVEDSLSHAIQHAALNNLSVLLPAAEIINGRIICGHAVWTALSAGAIGMAMLWRHQRKIAIPCALLGCLVACLDHLALDYAHYPSAIVWLQNILNTLAASGYLALRSFIAVLAAVICLDLFAMLNNLPKTKEFKFPTRKDRKEPLTALWDCVIDLRRLNYAYFRYRHYDDGQVPGPLALSVAVLAKRLVNRYLAAEPTLATVKAIAPLAAAVDKTAAAGAETAVEPKAEVREKSAGISMFDRRPLKELIDLPDRYKLQEEAFRGGMGIIFKAMHKQTRATLAIKVLHPHLADESNYLLRFEQEAKAASNLKHPNIVTVHDFGITPNSIAFLVMEWLEGPSLERVISLSGPLSGQRFNAIFIQTANALAHAHRKGIVHRDIKPSNIILTASDTSADNVKIVDFGIAKIVSGDLCDKMDLTISGDLLGSPLFMSPEQCSGGKIDHRSDIYSLGCVMYEALCGAPPLAGDNPAQTFQKHLTEMPKQPRMINAAIVRPELYEPMLFKCLQKDADKRYSSMEELEQELRSIEAALKKP
jgi:tRNA A-37 threonylcarbamoyl transferase component Bud32/RsiW-degrading membrane proteinase PrsW (M82 family)